MIYAKKLHKHHRLYFNTGTQNILLRNKTYCSPLLLYASYAVLHLYLIPLSQRAIPYYFRFIQPISHESFLPSFFAGKTRRSENHKLVNWLHALAHLCSRKVVHQCIISSLHRNRSYDYFCNLCRETSSSCCFVYFHLYSTCTTW